MPVRARQMCVAVALVSIALASVICLSAYGRPPRVDGEQFESVNRLLVQSAAEHQIAGAVALVVKDGSVVFHRAFGWQDVSQRTPMTHDTLFRIASMSKPITSVAVMMLREEGKLELDDPLSKYIPEFAAANVVGDRGDDKLQRAKREITIRDLLTHTSGITYRFLASEPLLSCYRSNGVCDGLSDSSFPLSENMRRLAQCPLASDPGSAWQYGLSTDVLGRVVEVVSGKPLDQFLRERIFVPLGMNDTSFHVPTQKLPRLATLYRPLPDGGLQPVEPGLHQEREVVYSATFPQEQATVYQSGGAGLVSTARDYARFLAMLLGEGSVDDVRLLQPETVKQMTTNQIGDLNTAFPIHGDKFGLGFGIHCNSLDRNGASIGAYSWGGAFHTFFWVDPERNVIGVLMTQLYPYAHLTLWKDFQASVYDALATRATEAADVDPQPGELYREYWTAFGGNRDWRVTDPAATADGAKEFLPNPQLPIVIDDLEHAVRAEVVLDRWGGHTKTTNQRIRFNDHEWVSIPEITATPQPQEYYYTQDNPRFDIPLAHLHEGKNVVTGTCSGLDGYDWGQWGLNALCVRVFYDPQRKSGSAACRIIAPESGDTIGDNPRIVVAVENSKAIRRVDVLAKYDGYDEDGDGNFCDWHQAYFKPSREASPALQAHVGTVVSPPFEVQWDTKWVPDQTEPIELVARVQDASGIWHVTNVVERLQLAREGARVVLYRPRVVPTSFGVRAGQHHSCVINIAEDARLDRAVEASLPLRTWHGWDEHHENLSLNNYRFAIAGKDHLYDMDAHSIPVGVLRRGENRFGISSRTEHHMLEILWPGPALLVRYEE